MLRMRRRHWHSAAFYARCCVAIRDVLKDKWALGEVDSADMTSGLPHDPEIGSMPGSELTQVT